jgi:phosphate uptake regulator
MNWTKKMGIQKGDLVFLSEESDGTLLLTAEPNKMEDNTVCIVDADQCDNTRVLDKVIVGNYVLGRSLIRVESSRRLMREQIETIRKATQRLLGIGIIEESDQHLLLQCSIDPKNFPISTVIQRLYVIISIMFKETLDSLVEEDLELAKDATTREHEADTMHRLIARLLASAQQSRNIAESIGIGDPMEIIYYNMIAWFLEMIGDRVNSLAYSVINLNQSEEDRENELIEWLSQIGLIVFTMFDKAVKSIFDGNVKIASDAVDLRETVELEQRTLLKEFQGRIDRDVAATVGEIAWELKIIAEYSSAIAEIAIDNVLLDENIICKVIEQPTAT